MRVRSLVLIACSLLMVPSAQATTFRIGLQPIVSLPQGDLRKKEFLDGKMGVGGGVHFMVGFDSGHATVLRSDYIQYKNEPEHLVNYVFKMNTLKVGIDHNYFLSKKVNQGIYFTAGLGYAHNRIQEGPENDLFEDTKGTFYYGAGLGYMFTSMIGVEVKYEEANYQHYQQTQSGQALNACVMIRF